MNVYPTYTVGTIFVVGIVQSILVWLALSSAVGKLGSTPVFKNLTRVGFAVFFATWFGLIFSLSKSDTFFALTQSGGRERALFALFMPSVVGLLLLGSATVRSILDEIPQHQLIGFQGLRTVGFVFLVFTDMGFVSPTFGVAAGVGDVTVGVFALYAAYSLLRGRRNGRSIAIAANVVGLLDAATALVLGLFVVPADSFAPQIATVFMFVPAFVVSLFLVAHIYSLRGLVLAVGEAQPPRMPGAAAHPPQESTGSEQRP
jgi:hypothetical protein